MPWWVAVAKSQRWVRNARVQGYAQISAQGLGGVAMRFGLHRASNPASGRPSQPDLADIARCRIAAVDVNDARLAAFDQIAGRRVVAQHPAPGQEHRAGAFRQAVAVVQRLAEQRLDPLLEARFERRRLSNISGLALVDLSDELSELNETDRAFGCLESLLVPVEIQRSDEFYVTPTELRSLVALVHAEFGRRIDAVGVAVDAIQKASSTPRTAQVKVQTIKAKP